MTEAERDIPDVIVLPPLIPLAALLLGLLLDWLMPGYFLRVFLTFDERLFLGGVLFIVGLVADRYRRALFLPRENKYPALQAGFASCDRRALRMDPQSDVCRFRLHHRGACGCLRVGLDVRADDPCSGRAASRRGSARRALSRSKIRRCLSPIHDARARAMAGRQGFRLLSRARTANRLPLRLIALHNPKKSQRSG